MLVVSGLTVSCITLGEQKTILKDVSFSIRAGEVLGVLGESGAGKSTLALALLQLLPASFRISSGDIRLDNQSLLHLSEDAMCSVRGKALSLVYQDSSVLNPVLRVEDQVYEVIRAHSHGKAIHCRRDARESLALVGLGDERFLSAYPHQLSGGQKQRVAIAQAIASKPSLLIADEPTASLDAGTTLEILDLFKHVESTSNTSILLISHQPDVLAYLADRVLVLYDGKIVEEGPACEVLRSPLHPYTQDLLRCQSLLESEPGAVNSKPLRPPVQRGRTSDALPTVWEFEGNA
jgi:peptide/nickel transport system ATP-binding protein